MTKWTNTRRRFTRNLAGIAIASPFLNNLLISCGSHNNEQTTDPCTDLSNLNHTDLATRQQFGYVKQSSLSDRTCENCQLFVKDDHTLPCGSCLVMKGPVADTGYCTVWAPRLEQ